VSNRDRIGSGLTPILGERSLTSVFREELQELLDERVRNGSSHSTVSHLRWDLKQIFDLAVAEGYVPSNPAKLLYVGREARRPERRIMNIEEVKKCVTIPDLRGRLVVKFALLAGMRPGEILALQWGCLNDRHADIRRRVYRGKVDSPKSVHSNRRVALPLGMSEDLRQWREQAVDTRDAGWVFPSEKLTTPVSRDNLWRRDILPHLKFLGLEWANFLVMRRTHSSLMSELNVDPKVVADQLGHTLDVNQNVYTQAGLHRRQAAVDLLEAALSESLMEQTEHTTPVN
jgi:integrase